MEATEKLRALALVRATVEEDAEAIRFLMEQPPTGCLIASLAAIAASTLERQHGRAGALQRVDGWLRLALAESVVAEEQR